MVNYNLCLFCFKRKKKKENSHQVNKQSFWCSLQLKADLPLGLLNAL